MSYECVQGGGPVLGQTPRGDSGRTGAYRRGFCPANHRYMHSLREISGIAAWIRRRVPRLRRKMAGITAAAQCSGRTSSATGLDRSFEIA
jgi:hypothetical protein